MMHMLQFYQVVPKKSSSVDALIGWREAHRVWGLVLSFYGVLWIFMVVH